WGWEPGGIFLSRAVSDQNGLLQGPGHRCHCPGDVLASTGIGLHSPQDKVCTGADRCSTKTDRLHRRDRKRKSADVVRVQYIESFGRLTNPPIQAAYRTPREIWGWGGASL